MIEIVGNYCTAIVYADAIEDTASEQIENLCNQRFAAGACIRIMPDVHAGAGCVIGFTGNLGEMIIPNIVGVDIGCGMLTVELGKIDVDFNKLDSIIKEKIPSGKHVHEGRMVRFPEMQSLHCYRQLRDTKRIERSLRTLGGGNHFIEIDEDDHGSKYLVVHSGSRNLGKQVAEYYQEMAYEILCGKDEIFDKKKQLIKDYKNQGKKTEIEQALKALDASFESKESNTPKGLCYLVGDYRDMYLNDMKICQEYASLNRHEIASSIVESMLGCSLDSFEFFETVHNYIDHDNNIIRKGAVSAREGEKILIPINMRDGSLICFGKGNADWNYSAPHGAGRLFSRSAAKEKFTVEDFQEQMRGVFSTSISNLTLDECPMAYKGMDAILNQIEPTADVHKIIRPVFNFKAQE